MSWRLTGFEHLPGGGERIAALLGVGLVIDPESRLGRRSA
jgi:hypothetical protein